MICEPKSTKRNSSNYCYVTITIQLNLVICLHTVKCSNGSIPNNLI